MWLGFSAGLIYIYIYIYIICVKVARLKKSHERGEGDPHKVRSVSTKVVPHFWAESRNHHRTLTLDHQNPSSQELFGELWVMLHAMAAPLRAGRISSKIKFSQTYLTVKELAGADLQVPDISARH